ncbi:MAG TPA: arginine repressor [Candidatus Dormibacteraeota bacterium]|nr:arginine repressor [Candidatus Dormibacteraeota bacterium]
MSSAAPVAPRAPESPRTAKSVRQRAILDLVRARAIRTQDELVDALRGLHLDVTQATVSRDVRDLGLVRAADGEGLRYVSGVGDVDPQGPSSRVRSVFRDHVRSIEFVDHLGVVRGRPSTAPLVAAAIDAAHFEEVAGTVAGDDTVLVVARGRAAASRLQARLESFIGARR